jgi:hypothetical protein
MGLSSYFSKFSVTLKKIDSNEKIPIYITYTTYFCL